MEVNSQQARSFASLRKIMESGPVGGEVNSQQARSFASLRKTMESGPVGGEVSSGDPVFPTGTQRGNPGTDDWYHVVSIRFRYPIFDRALEMDFPRYLFRKRGWPYHN